MEFDCQTIIFSKSVIGATGLREPLCNNCVQTECSNPIRYQVVSVMGIPSKWRLWIVGNNVRQVVECKGYIDPKTDYEFLSDITEK